MKALLSFRLECSGNLQLNFDAVMDAPKVQTNGSAVDWGKVSKSKIKDVSPEERLKDKKVFKIRLEDLLKIKKNT